MIAASAPRPRFWRLETQVADRNAEIVDPVAAFNTRAASGRLEIQCCAACGSYCWPPRERCRDCWADDLVWTPISPAAELLAAAALHTTFSDWFRARLPWRIGTVRLAPGIVATAHLAPAVGDGGAVRIAVGLDSCGRGVLSAFPSGAPQMDMFGRSENNRENGSEK